MKYIIASIILFSVTSTWSQQGRNFSMWFHNNMQHNPAAVATNDNDMQLFTNFRYQYFTVTDKPYQTISGSIEGKLFRSDTRNGYLGIGGSFMNDMSGDGRYSNNQFTIPIAYHLFFNENNFMSVGVSPGMYQRSISPGNFTWESQWNGYEFNNSQPSENVANASVANFDLGAGVFYNYKEDNTRKIYFGFATQHILQPKLDFNIRDNLARRFTAQAGANYKFDNSTFGISPQVIAMFQGPNRNIMFGSNFDFYLQEPSKRTLFFQPTIFSFGIYHRIKDAVVANFQYTFKGMTIALSYDSNINTMLPASKSVGALELALKYDLIWDKKGKFIY
ncbi:MAG: PorP/SprF family type IX secretion system membrane protein [Bacteroidota bacterium]